MTGSSVPARGATAQVVAAAALCSSMPCFVWGFVPTPTASHHGRFITRAARFANGSPPGFSQGRLGRCAWPWTRHQVAAGVILATAAQGQNDDPRQRAKGRTTAVTGGSLDDVDPETLARAREAAKTDDYGWFMEFIEGNDSEDDGAGGPAGGYQSWTNSNDDPQEEQEQLKSRRRWATGAGPESFHDDDRYPERSRRRDSQAGVYYDDPPDAEGRPRSRRAGDDGRGRGRGASSRRGYGTTSASALPFDADSNTGNSYRGPSTGVRTRYPVPADTAYDYDFDDEFEGDAGRGGWEYDPGLTAEVAARRRDVDVEKVRSRAKVAAQRLPLADDYEGEDEGGWQEANGDVESGGKEQDPIVSSISPEKVTILMGELGYTEQEVSCMDPDMADLAVDRKLRRPASGMPPDWTVSGDSGLPLPTISGRENDGSGNDRHGALDLDEMLWESRDGGGRRGLPTRRRREGGQPASRGGVSSKERGLRVAEDGYYPPSPRGRTGYDDDDDDGREYYGDIDEKYWERREQRRLGEQRSRRKGDSTGRRGRGRVEMDPAERYELNMRGDGTEFEEEEEEQSIWTGVGEEGPWPSLEEFTKLLRDETDVRLSIIGPWAADAVALENKFRIDAYAKWLEVLQKGIGETLQDAGFFDAALRDDDDDNYYLNEFDDVTDRRRSEYNPRGDRDERGFDYERGGERGRREEEEGERRQRPQRRRRRTPAGPDLSAVLSSGANPANWGTPVEGLEAQAARFERSYPGNKKVRRLPSERDTSVHDSVIDGRRKGEESPRLRREVTGRVGRDDAYGEEGERDRRRSRGDGIVDRNNGAALSGELDDNELF